MSDDEKYLTMAAELSRKGMLTRAGGPFGAVIVKDGQIIGEGWNDVTSRFDPTAHAEINAIRRACHALSTFSLQGAALYSSCEPCPMCLGAIYWARLDKLVFANSRDEAAAIGFDDNWLYEEVPKSLVERSIPTFRIPNETAKATFAEWIDLPDKVPY